MFDTSITLLEKAMVGAGRRHEALSANVANANTPGYRRIDVDFHSALSAAMGSSDRDKELADVVFSPENDAMGSVRADGNGVDVDREMAALTENNLEYQAIAGVLRQRFRALETVIGSR
ncbi:MAG: flagellar basal body rod protein FlgB [Gaiellales bacterium]